MESHVTCQSFESLECILIDFLLLGDLNMSGIAWREENQDSFTDPQ